MPACNCYPDCRKVDVTMDFQTQNILVTFLDLFMRTINSIKNWQTATVIKWQNSKLIWGI